ncbi:MaoC family dehydratase [Paraburkholderia sp. LEh10]|jgi:acyl dehydratase|uniref:MaoC family dehydratase n=1 Tax=Paraburkholderia sp. LEh10 TaxID=2821353 RepID=UPI001AE24336|nr:MaoC family dehydratase [Paraburkholderia sp. LEh10]MBP0592276.1 MaoC family dehydratase [Paraburkholderia sp. LEh10]
MTRRYLEDLRVGETWTSDAVTIEADDVIDFGRKFDPQPFHTDPDAARASPFGGLIASGWHLASLAMRLCVKARLFGETPIVGVGADELRWLQPVRPGDTVRVKRELVEIQTIPDKPRRGVAKARIDLINQRGEVVMRLYGLTSIPRRPADGTP